MSQRRVLIGTPTMDGRLDARYVHSLTQTVRHCSAIEIDAREIFMMHDAILPNLRNQIVRLAVEYKYDDLIFIDSDIDWDAKWVAKLLTHPVDCVGGTYRKKQESESYEAYSFNGNWTTNEHGLIKVDALGAGFLRLSHNALRALWNGSTPYQCRDESQTRMIFEYGVANGKHVGEDAMLAIKLKHLGFPIYLDPTMTCGHTGSKNYIGDFAKWLAAHTVTT